MSSQQWGHQARGILRGLHAASDVVRSSAVVSYDGLVLASVLAPGVDSDRFGAMCASLLALSVRASQEVERGLLRQVILDCELGPVLLTRAGDAGVLAIATDPTKNLGKLILDTRSAASALANLGGETE